MSSLASLASSAVSDGPAPRGHPWAALVRERLDQMAGALDGWDDASNGFVPDAPLPEPAHSLLAETLERAAALSFADYRYLVEQALPELAAEGGPHRALSLRLLTELRKRLQFCDLGGKALSSMEYLTDGGRDADGSPQGGVYRVLDAVPPLFEALRAKGDGLRWGRLGLDTRSDLLPPDDPERDVLVIDFAGFKSESFGLDSASRFVSEAVRLGWRRLVGYDFIGGPRYVATNLSEPDRTRARGVLLELYGREFGDFTGALLEGAEVWAYGQGQSHWGLKADSGYLFVLQDALNTCMYAAHGGTMSVWDSGSRFAVAGQNKVYYPDGKRLAPGFKSIHFGSPNEYAFEYLMSGGENSLHVVMGLRKPDARGQLALKPRPYLGKFLMSGAAAGRVFLFDPQRRLEPAQYRGNVPAPITAQEWTTELAPFLTREAGRRGAPLRVDHGQIWLRMEGTWRSWPYEEAFLKLIPITVAKAAQEQGVVPPALVQMVAE